MKIIHHLFSGVWIEAIGWTLVHSLWQGTLIALLLGLFLVLMRKRSAQLKYFVSFFALVALLAWSVGTFVHSYSYASDKAALKANIIASPDYLRNLLKSDGTPTPALEKANENLIDLNLIKFRSFLQRNFPFVCTIWLFGILFLLFRLAANFIYLHRLRTFGLNAIADEWMNKLHELAEKLTIRRKVEAYFSPLVKSPVTMGAFKPIILLPISAFTGLSPKETEAILAHELAHIFRNDYFFNILQSIMEILFFYHPGIWFISAQIRKERENSCDNIAIELTGDKVAFVKAIAAAEIYRMEQDRLAMAFASSKGNTLQRIKRLQNNIAMKTNFFEGLIAAGVIVIGLTLASFTIGSNTEQSTKPALENVNKPEITQVEVDSILKNTQENILKNKDLEPASEELGKAIEAALSEQDEEISAELLEEINRAIKDLNIEKIVHEAMAEAQKALNEAKGQIHSEEMKHDMEEARRDIEKARDEIARSKNENKDEIKSDMKDARRDIERARAEVEEDFRREMEKATTDVEREGLRIGMEAATAGLNVAAAILGSIPVEEIIQSALTGVEAALDAIAEIDFDSAAQPATFSEKEIIQHNKDLKNQNKNLIQQQKQLEKQQKELEKQMEILQKQLDSLKKSN